MLLHQLLTDGAMRRPDHTAFHWVEREKSLTYAQAVEQVEAAAGAFHDLGARKGDRITIFAHNGMDYLISMFAAWRIGAISALVNVKFADELDYYFADHTPTLVVYTHDKIAEVKAAAEASGAVRHLICMDGKQDGALSFPELLDAKLPPPPDPGDEAAIAHLSYTSGTTGQPKGACLAHEPTQTASAVIGERLRYSRDDISFGPSALSSSYQLVANVLPPLRNSATCIVMKDWTPEAGYAAVRKTGATIFVGNPPVLADLLEQSRVHGGAPATLRMSTSGGGPVPPALKRAWRDELKLPLVESYGQSEIGGFFALADPVLPDDAHFGAVGRPLPDKEVRILGADDQELPIGQPGQVCLRGGFMTGYWGKPDKTAETLSGGWLHSGDVGQMSAEGYLTMRGRASELLRVGGETWFPRDIEEAMMLIEGIRDAAVVGLDDGDGGHRPIAFVTGPGKIDMAQTLAGVADKTPYDLSTLEIRQIDEFPMTPTGKIAKATLRDQAAASN
ncbi:class I adenylate-forming enzyme family protein [Oricola indica]|uniref:class I adenylate-forming enzyme family protein n=1 Tax=Oricola indica TaxID=2872591 RepID=UPI003CCBAD99